MEVETELSGLIPGAALITVAFSVSFALSLIGAPDGVVTALGLSIGLTGFAFLMNAAMKARRGLEELKREYHLD